MYDDLSDIDRAKRDIVHNVKPDVKEIATATRINYGTLCNKVNPFIDTHHLTVDEGLSIQLYTGSRELIKAEARALGGVFVPIPESIANTSDMALLEAWARWNAEIGETAEAIRAALEDGDISKTELQSIRKEIFEDFSRELELLNRLEALCDEK